MPVIAEALAQVASSANPERVIRPAVLMTSKIFRHVFDRFTFVHLAYSYLTFLTKPFLAAFSTEPLRCSAPWSGLLAAPVRPPAEGLPPSCDTADSALATSTRYGKFLRGHYLQGTQLHN